MVVEAIDTFRGIDIDQAALAGLQEVQVDDRGKAKLPIDRSKAGIALKQVRLKQKSLGPKELFAFTKEAFAIGRLGCEPAGDGQPPNVEGANAARGQIQKPVWPKMGSSPLMRLRLNGSYQWDLT